MREAWTTMEALQKEGKVKSIGVSNFRISDMQELLKVAKVRQLLPPCHFSLAESVD
jgi:diketogulonate reductase-like aldo/keto reductase